MIEGALRTAAETASLAIGTVAVLIVVWRRYGVWLLLGLEFELAADIIETVISPEWMDIAQLAAIAVIRTFLNYFLEKDLEASVREAGEASMRLSAPRAS
jgi:uncharacterized membrane protein